jgi:hypothetical protein
LKNQRNAQPLPAACPHLAHPVSRVLHYHVAIISHRFLLGVKKEIFMR